MGMPNNTPVARATRLALSFPILWVLAVAMTACASGGASASQKAAPRRSAKKGAGAAASGDDLTSPMQGTIVKIDTDVRAGA